MPIVSEHTVSPLVSIIIPAFNHEQYVEQALLSAIEQAYENLEIIIIDDGSTDNTVVVIERVLAESHHERDISFIRQSNQGLSKTLNIALGMARGEYIQFLASDDAYLPDKTAKCVEALQVAGETVGAVYSDGYMINDRNQKICKFSDKFQRPLSKNTYKELLLGNWIPAMGVLYRKSALDEVGWFDETFQVEDYDMLLRLSKVFKIVPINDLLFLYRWHETNFSKNQKVMNQQLEKLAAKNSDLASFNDLKQNIEQRGILVLLKNTSILNWELIVRTLVRRVVRWSRDGR